MTSYHGGKQRIGKKLATEIYKKGIKMADDRGMTISGYCEPFCGMLGVYQHIPALFEDYTPKLKYKAGDTNKSVILLWKQAQKGRWKIPPKISAKKFLELKYNGRSTADKGFIGHFYGFMGKYFVPFKSWHTPSQVKKAGEKVIDIATTLKKVSFTAGKYTQYSKLKNNIIYCDPPYKKQAQYYDEKGNLMKPFDTDAFWKWCKKMAEHNIVFVSEYSAPKWKGIKKIWETHSKTPKGSMKETLYVVQPD